MSGLQLGLFLIIAGGAIAYIGDRIGLKVGKKRLTLFGLRPKHTSIIITIVTGALIAGASIGLLMAVSRDVRNALFSMKAVQTELRQSRQALGESLAQLDELESTVAEQRASLLAIERAREKATAERDAAQEERARLEEEYVKAQGELRQLQGDVQNWKARVEELKELGATLEDSVAKMQLTEKQLREDITIMTEQYLALEGQMRTGAFAFLKDEIIAATVLAGGHGEQQAEADLLAFLEEADRIALQRGARIAGKESAVTLAKEEYFFQAAKVLQSNAGPWVVRAVASQNTVEGEPVLVYLHLFPDERIYRAGEVIAERVMNSGRATREQELLRLLQQVNEAAINRGMITTGDGDVGQLDGEQFIEAMVQLRRVGGPARVEAVAKRDTHIARGPLQVEIRVTPLS